MVGFSKVSKHNKQTNQIRPGKNYEDTTKTTVYSKGGE